jgi:hypothetical protein
MSKPYIYWPVSVSPAALQAIIEAVEIFYPSLVMQPPAVQVELQNIVNEGRAMLQKQPAQDEDDLLA